TRRASLSSMRRTRPSASPLADALQRVGDRWTLLVVAALLEGAKRFNELQDELDGIAPNVLSARLKLLGEQALLVARPYSERPPLLRAPAALRVRADRGWPRAGGSAAAVGRLGRPRGRPAGAAAPRALRHAARGALVVPELRGLGRP